MPTVEHLLEGRSRLGLSLLAGPASGKTIRHVTAVESLKEVTSVPAGSLLVVTPAASISAATWNLDVAIRQAVDHGIAAMVLVGRDVLPSTSSSLADRGELSVLTVSAESDIANLVLRIDRLLHGGAAFHLARAESAMNALREAEEACVAVDEALEATSAELDKRLAYAEDETYDESAGKLGKVSVKGHVVGHVWCDDPDDAVRLVLPAAAGVVGRLLEAENQRRFAPTQTRAEIINQILVAERAQLPMLADQVRALGLPIDRTHTVAWIHVRELDVKRRSDPLWLRRQVKMAESIALRFLDTRPGTWHVARAARHLVVVRTTMKSDDDLVHTVQRIVQQLIELLNSQTDIELFAAVGTPQRGPEGLQHSAQEASSAADAAKARRSPGNVSVFNAGRLQRILSEFYGSPLTRRLLAEILAPIDAQGPTKSNRDILTLGAYLDAQGSPTKAAEVLNLHPNTVTYRIGSIVELLASDLSDPDTRFALHLACKLRQF